MSENIFIHVILNKNSFSNYLSFFQDIYIIPFLSIYLSIYLSIL